MSIKKGLFIGIDYLNSSAELANCRNDAHDMHKLLTERYGIQEAVTLVDDSPADKKPTKSNILKWIKWLVDGTSKDDILFIHYSGHGSYTRDRSGDEEDGQDETIVPVDYSQAGQITDDTLNDVLCKPIVTSGATLYALFDCCHSGSNTDDRFLLKQVPRPHIRDDQNEYDEKKYDIVKRYRPSRHFSYYYLFNGKFYSFRAFRALMRRTRYRNRRRAKLVRFDKRKKNVIKKKKTTVPQGGKYFQTIEDFKTPKLVGGGKVVRMGSALDNQTASDGFSGRENGAFTGALITFMAKNKHSTWGNLLGSIRDMLKKRGYTQVPMLSSSYKVNFEDESFIGRLKN